MPICTSRGCLSPAVHERHQKCCYEDRLKPGWKVVNSGDENSPSNGSSGSCRIANDRRRRNWPDDPAYRTVYSGACRDPHGSASLPQDGFRCKVVAVLPATAGFYELAQTTYARTCWLRRASATRHAGKFWYRNGHAGIDEPNSRRAATPDLRRASSTPES